MMIRTSMALLDVYGLVLLRTFSHKNCKKCLLLVNKPHTPHWRRSPPMRGWLSSRRQRNWWLWQRFFSSAWLCRLAPVWFKNLAKHLNVQESVNKPITKYHEVNPPVVLFLIFSVFSQPLPGWSWACAISNTGAAKLGVAALAKTCPCRTADGARSLGMFTAHTR